MSYYFDNNATTKLSLKVSKAMFPVALYDYGNPSSIYSLGKSSKILIDEARKSIAHLFQAEQNSIVFTGSATESNNTIIHSALLQNPKRKTVMFSAVEHPSVYNTLLQYQKKGYNLRKIPVHESGIDEEYIFKNLSTDVALVTIMTVNNETGQIFPVNSIFKRIKEFDSHIICHSDTVQAIGKVDVSSKYIDYMSISAHKFHGPKGVGCIYKSSDMELHPLLYGGAQENNMRAGTENVSGIVGMGVALSEAIDSMPTINKINDLRDTLEDAMSVYDSYVVCKHTNRAPGVTNIGFSGFEANSLLLKLNHYNIFVSTGSACSSKRIGISRIIKEMDIPEKYRSTIRISMSRDTTQEEVYYLIEKLNCILSKNK